MVKVKRLFKANCGTGARYLSHGYGERDGFKVLLLNFEMTPEGRTFNLDQVIRGEADSDLEQAVLRVAQIARDIREYVRLH